MPFLDSQSPKYREELTTFGPRLSETYFKPFAERRQPRTSALVKGARAQGKMRTVSDPQECANRNLMLSRAWKDLPALEAKYGALLQEPFQTLE